MSSEPHWLSGTLATNPDNVEFQIAINDSDSDSYGVTSFSNVGTGTGRRRSSSLVGNLSDPTGTALKKAALEETPRAVIVAVHSGSTLKD
jgi:hypothetical protein